MKQITCETKEEPVTYERAIKPFNCEIKALATKIMKELDAADLNEWAKLETLRKAKIKVEDSLGTVVDPRFTDVRKEEQRMEELYWQAYENQCIEHEVASIIGSPGYKFRNFTKDQIWQIVAEAEHYW